MKAIAMAYFLVLLSSGIQAADTVAYELDAYGRMQLNVSVNEHARNCFILDTASHRFALARQELAGIGVERQRRSSIRHVSSSGFLKLPLAFLDQVSVGPINLTKLPAAVFPENKEVCGLIGLEAFAGYVLHIQPDQGVIGLNTSSAYFARNGWSLVTGIPTPNGSIMIDTPYHGLELTVILASGLSKSLLDLGAAKNLFPEYFSSDGFELITSHGRTEVVEGLLPNSRSRETLVLPDLDIKGWRLGRLEVALGSLHVPDHTGYMNANLLLLGADLLSTKELALDIRAYQLWVPPKR